VYGCKKKRFVSILTFWHVGDLLAEFFGHADVASRSKPGERHFMKMTSQNLFANCVTRISSQRQGRRQRLTTAIPAAADYVLESRLMLSATTDDPTGMGDGLAGGTNTGNLGDTNNGAGDPLTGGGTAGAATGGGGAGSGSGSGSGGGIAMGHMPPILSVTRLPIPDTVVNGDVVAYATAIDPDVGDTPTFSFYGGSLIDPSGTFAIDANTGVITIANAVNIGSQDESDDSPTGWSFPVTVVASDLDPMHDASQLVTLEVNRTEYKINKPADGAKIREDVDVIFDGTRPKNVKVRVVIRQKGSGPDYDIEIPNGDKEINPNNTTRAEADFKKLEVGEYELTYYKRMGVGGWGEVGKIKFRVVPKP
jgi:hypothetical protein